MNASQPGAGLIELHSLIARGFRNRDKYRLRARFIGRRPRRANKALLVVNARANSTCTWFGSAPGRPRLSNRAGHLST